MHHATPLRATGVETSLSQRSPPLEVLYSICAFVAAEYLDSIIAGSLKYTPSTVTQEGAAVTHTCPTLTAHNPLVQLLQTSHALRNATLMVISDALGIPVEEDSIRKLATKPWTQIQPVRLLVHEMGPRPLRSYVLSSRPRCIQSGSPLLQNYERLALLLDFARSLPNRSSLLLNRARPRLRSRVLSSDTPASNFESAKASFASLCDSNRIFKVFEAGEFPPSQEGLATLVGRRLSTFLYLNEYVSVFWNAIWLADLTHSRGDELSTLPPQPRELANMIVSRALKIVDSTLAERPKRERDQLLLYNDDDWDVTELLDMAGLKPSEPVPPGDLVTRFYWGLRQLKPKLESYRDILEEEERSEAPDVQTMVAAAS